MSIMSNVITISILVSVSVFLCIFALFSKDKERGARGVRENDWLWKNAAEKLYDAIFQNSDPISVGKKFGLEYDKYMLSCYIIGRTPNIKQEVMNRVTASIAFLAGAILSAAFLNPAPLVIGIVLYYLMVVNVVNGAQSTAKQRKRMITQELPRFADLLHSALVIDMPIESAIDMISQLLPGVLAQEMRYAMAEMKMGAKNWQTALEDMARKYEVDIFSDFVLDLITASNKGVPIIEAVARKSTEIKQQKLLDAKESASKMSNTVLVPIAVFKIIPLLAILLVPVMIQIFTNF
jgi:tight adherence protein C